MIEEIKMIQCQGCGNKYPQGTKYCNGCGRVVDIKPSINRIHSKSESTLTPSQIEHNEFLKSYKSIFDPPRILITEEEYREKCQIYDERTEELQRINNTSVIIFIVGFIIMFIGAFSDMIFIWIGVTVWVLGFIWAFSQDPQGGQGVERIHPDEKYTNDPKYENIIKEEKD